MQVAIKNATYTEVLHRRPTLMRNIGVAHQTVIAGDGCGTGVFLNCERSSQRRRLDLRASGRAAPQVIVCAPSVVPPAGSGWARPQAASRPRASRTLMTDVAAAVYQA